MLRVEPRDGNVGIKRRPPLESTVRLHRHAEEGHGEAGEIVVYQVLGRFLPV